MEETLCDACKIHFRDRKHFYEEKHKERINTCTREDVESISAIKRVIDTSPRENVDLTKYYLHCRYCECPTINRKPLTEPFTTNKSLLEHLTKKRHKEKAWKYLKVFNGKKSLLPDLVLSPDYYQKYKLVSPHEFDKETEAPTPKVPEKASAPPQIDPDPNWLPKFTSTWKGESRKERQKLFGYTPSKAPPTPYKRKYSFHKQ